MKRYRKKYLNKKRKRKHMMVVMAEYFIFVIIICILYLCYNFFEQKKNESLYNTTEKNVINKLNFSTEKKDNSILNQLISAQTENSEVIGWINIPDTDISYPLLQTNDNSYYLTHNYKKQNSTYGSIFLHKNNDITDEFANLLIYGHNINKGSQMFSSLLNYESQDFYSKHKTIIIMTADKTYEYTIFSVLKSKVYNTTDTNVFRYYNYPSLNLKENFTEYVSSCKKYQLYTTNTSALYGNQLITLITCEYSQENGRLVVVGKKVKTYLNT